MKYQKITWEDIQEFVNLIKLNRHYDYIVAIHRGGLPLGVMLSHKFDIPLLIAYISLYDNSKQTLRIDIPESLKGKSILIVDDISDKGISLSQVYSYLNLEHNASIVNTLTYCYRWNTQYIPTYYHYAIKIESDDWIQFPWEYSDNN